MSLRSLRATGGICGRCYNRHVLLDLWSSAAEIPPLAQHFCETLGKVAVAAEDFQGCIVCKQLAHMLTWKEATHKDFDFFLPVLKTQIWTSLFVLPAYWPDLIW